MLRREEWLAKAQRLAVGMQDRVRHAGERDAAMTIRNLPDRWVAYCQRCKEGGLVMKEHVKVSLVREDARTMLELPRDLVTVVDHECRDIVARFLASKDMDLRYFASARGLRYSAERGRLVLTENGASLGRAMHPEQVPKWITYDGQHYLSTHANIPPPPAAVVVEDAFSYHKVRYALRRCDCDTAVYCSLGTGQHYELLRRLLLHSQVVFMYDGDRAGARGAVSGAKAVRALGVLATAHCAPSGKDPKSMSIQDIQQHLEAICRPQHTRP